MPACSSEGSASKNYAKLHSNVERETRMLQVLMKIYWPIQTTEPLFSCTLHTASI